ncbi:uncharacterized protein PHACADRAFT_28091 [Phanerochaete carnosa HHB-10118-sp]|uniref:Uncharacterized protein n=1 Tax=Phanerochaete carnosa (strain HHB-10118-sp) TaxID=650164 RepID=K5VU23_PHACS|nr:uncharacterized protein PHACADRAFT_28091 [Phanerochaete carnosa HHB-10118-sp]EKM55008.1 hypothetical protein PHACADRAFT_28091 [Phanerochaete carnosa HHB-10118-sp]
MRDSAGAPSVALANYEMNMSQRCRTYRFTPTTSHIQLICISVCLQNVTFYGLELFTHWLLATQRLKSHRNTSQREQEGRLALKDTVDEVCAILDILGVACVDRGRVADEDARDLVQELPCDLQVGAEHAASTPPNADVLQSSCSQRLLSTENKFSVNENNGELSNISLSALLISSYADFVEQGWNLRFYGLANNLPNVNTSGLDSQINDFETNNLNQTKQSLLQNRTRYLSSIPISHMNLSAVVLTNGTVQTSQRCLSH